LGSYFSPGNVQALHKRKPIRIDKKGKNGSFVVTKGMHEIARTYP